MPLARLVFFTLLALALDATVAAQDRAEVAVGVALPTQPFGEPWTAGPGAAGRLMLPLHGGSVEAVLRVLPFDGSTLPDSLIEAPDFLLIGATVGWGYPLRLGPAVLTPTARVGAVQFRFDPEDDQFEAQLANEAEVAVGGALRLSVPLGRLSVWAEGEALRIALRDPETLASLSAGVGLRFGVPPLVRRLLDE